MSHTPRHSRSHQWGIVPHLSASPLTLLHAPWRKFALPPHLRSGLHPQVYNPGLRDAIKEYSAWPTIPQLYVDGEFVGGCDIAEEMLGNGELAKMLRKD